MSIEGVTFNQEHAAELTRTEGLPVPAGLERQFEVAKNKTFDDSTRATALGMVTSQQAAEKIFRGRTQETNEEMRVLIAQGDRRDRAAAKAAAPGMIKDGAKMFAVGAVALTVAILAFSGVFGHLSTGASVGIGIGAGLSGFVMFVGGVLMAVSLKDQPIEKARK